MRKPGFDACHRRGCRLQSSFRVAAAATQVCAGVGRGVNRSELKDLSAMFHQLPAPEVGRRVLASGEYWQSHTDDDYQGTVLASHLRKSFATNSGPLSERRCSGTPFITITSASALMTRDEDQRRSARTSRLSRVCSSIRLSRRTLRPSCVRALTKS